MTALPPAGFSPGWEQTCLFAVLGAMRTAARLLPEGLVCFLARSAVGRSVLVSTIYAPPRPP
ncbi:hypothetical protein [Streptomyces sp. V3I7]|uniref:hypothetical protein n=1 Tax=Streptomyces sp. V3I7 TaxID=3042278 RepID=UPI0027872095|nr:hypothetical protein [Streptomyces sp. V3I7]MDQ0993460.1 hypothetical protein [Streptomyces sp. V3I7]